jgi:hypothetical protein
VRDDGLDHALADQVEDLAVIHVCASGGAAADGRRSRRGMKTARVLERRAAAPETSITTCLKLQGSVVVRPISERRMRSDIASASSESIPCCWTDVTTTALANGTDAFLRSDMFHVEPSRQTTCPEARAARRR